MKIATLSALSICIGLTLQAQPTVDGSSFTNATSSLLYINATPLWQAPFDLQSDGENLVWDLQEFSGIMETNEDFFAMSALGLAYSLQFALAGNPEASPTHVREAIQLDDVEVPLEFSDIYEFYQNNAQGYAQVGLSFSISNFPLVTVFTDIDRIYRWPLQYDDRDTSYSSYLVSLPTFGAYGIKGFRYNHVDAWGTMITPDGTFDVLRVRSELLLTDTVNFPALEIEEVLERPLQVDYKWISPQLDGELLRITTVGGQILSAQMQNLSTVNVQNVFADKSLKLWPNPSLSHCNISLPAKLGRVEVFDTNGRQMAYANNVNADVYTVQTEQWPQGMYFIRYVDPSGTPYTAKMLHQK